MGAIATGAAAEKPAIAETRSRESCMMKYVCSSGCKGV
jgi:hypothetical protein